MCPKRGESSGKYEQKKWPACQNLTFINYNGGQQRVNRRTGTASDGNTPPPPHDDLPHPEREERPMTARECATTGSTYIHVAADELDELLARELGGK